MVDHMDVTSVMDWTITSMTLCCSRNFHKRDHLCLITRKYCRRCQPESLLNTINEELEANLK